MVVVAEWSFNLPPARMDEFRAFCEREARPLWRSLGAMYAAHRCVATRVFRYQTDDDETRIVEQVRFDSLDAFRRFGAAYGKHPERFPALAAYEGRLGAGNPSFRLYEEL